MLSRWYNSDSFIFIQSNMGEFNVIGRGNLRKNKYARHDPACEVSTECNVLPELLRM